MPTSFRPRFPREMFSSSVQSWKHTHRRFKYGHVNILLSVQFYSHVRGIAYTKGVEERIFTYVSTFRYLRTLFSCKSSPSNVFALHKSGYHLPRSKRENISSWAHNFGSPYRLLPPHKQVHATTPSAKRMFLPPHHKGRVRKKPHQTRKTNKHASRLP